MQNLITNLVAVASFIREARRAGWADLPGDVAARAGAARAAGLKLSTSTLYAGSVW